MDVLGKLPKNKHKLNKRRHYEPKSHSQRMWWRAAQRRRIKTCIFSNFICTYRLSKHYTSIGHTPKHRKWNPMDKYSFVVRKSRQENSLHFVECGHYTFCFPQTSLFSIKATLRGERMITMRTNAYATYPFLSNIG